MEQFKSVLEVVNDRIDVVEKSIIKTENIFETQNVKEINTVEKNINKCFLYPHSTWLFWMLGIQK